MGGLSISILIHFWINASYASIVVWLSISAYNIHGNSDNVRLQVGSERFPVDIGGPLAGKKMTPEGIEPPTF
jgi:hypothetical protein